MLSQLPKAGSLLSQIQHCRFSHRFSDDPPADAEPTARAYQLTRCRAATVIGADKDAPARPRTLSHIVYFVPDMERMSKFYIDRLGFVITDKFINTGPFLRPQANDDHHVLFMIETPE